LVKDKQPAIDLRDSAAPLVRPQPDERRFVFSLAAVIERRSREEIARDGGEQSAWYE
jgi:hypothetical protein